MPVVMGGAAKNDGPATDAATVGTPLATFDDIYRRLTSSPDASRNNAGYPQQLVVTLEDCDRAYEDYKTQYGDKPWSVLGNEALKSLREVLEEEWKPKVEKVDLFHQDIMHIPKMHHDKVGALYWMDKSETVPWSWKVMIAKMQHNSKKDFTQDGIVAFWFACKNKVDTQRLGTFGNKYATTPKVWDFYITRRDGKTWSLHPAHTTSTARVIEVSDLPSTPRSLGFEKTQDSLNRLHPFKGCAQRPPSEQARVDQYEKDQKKEAKAKGEAAAKAKGRHLQDASSHSNG